MTTQNRQKSHAKKKRAFSLSFRLSSPPSFFLIDFYSVCMCTSLSVGLLLWSCAYLFSLRLHLWNYLSLFICRSTLSNSFYVIIIPPVNSSLFVFQTTSLSTSLYVYFANSPSVSLSLSHLSLTSLSISLSMCKRLFLSSTVLTFASRFPFRLKNSTCYESIKS